MGSPWRWSRRRRRRCRRRGCRVSREVGGVKLPGGEAVGIELRVGDELAGVVVLPLVAEERVVGQRRCRPGGRRRRADGDDCAGAVGGPGLHLGDALGGAEAEVPAAAKALDVGELRLLGQLVDLGAGLELHDVAVLEHRHLLAVPRDVDDGVDGGGGAVAPRGSPGAGGGGRRGRRRFDGLPTPGGEDLTNHAALTHGWFLRETTMRFSSMQLGPGETGLRFRDG